MMRRGGGMMGERSQEGYLSGFMLRIQCQDQRTVYGVESAT